MGQWGGGKAAPRGSQSISAVEVLNNCNVECGCD